MNYPGNRPGDEVIYNSNNLNNVLNNPPYNLDPNQPTIYNSYPINDPYQYPNQQNQPGGILTSGVGIYSMVGSCTAQPCYNEGVRKLGCLIPTLTNCFILFSSNVSQPALTHIDVYVVTTTMGKDVRAIEILKGLS